MYFTITTGWHAEKVKVKDILRDSHKYTHCEFIEGEWDDPWKYNEEWFLEQRANKSVFALDYQDSTARLEE